MFGAATNHHSNNGRATGQVAPTQGGMVQMQHASNRKVLVTQRNGGMLHKGNRYTVGTNTTATYSDLYSLASPVVQCPGCLAPNKMVCECESAMAPRKVDPAQLQAQVIARHVAKLQALPVGLIAGYLAGLPKTIRLAVLALANS